MSKCRNCSAEIPEGASVCPSCGSKRELIHTSGLPSTSKAAEHARTLGIIAAVLLLPGLICTVACLLKAPGVTKEFSKDPAYAKSCVAFMHITVFACAMDGLSFLLSGIGVIAGFAGTAKKVRRKNRALTALLICAVVLLASLICLLLAVDALLGDKGFFGDDIEANRQIAETVRRAATVFRL